ncbi:MAG: nuclear transport factor 2 family protein [Leptothrix sp. (in: b-proteobacteria)]
MTSTATLSAIEDTVQAYFEGLHHGDSARLRQVFHADARIVGHHQGAYASQSLDEWLAEVDTLPKPVEQGERVDMHIVAIDATGEAAAVKVAVLYLGLAFTDYLSLLCQGGAWVVMHKTYHHD